MPVDLLLLALDYYRAPLRYPLLADPRRTLPKNFAALLGAMAEALAPANLEQVASRLRARPEEIEQAARFFVRHVLLAPDADHYRALGLAPGAGPDAIRLHYHLLIRLFHPDRQDPDDRDFDGGTETVRLNTAYQILRKPAARAQYDARIQDEAERTRRRALELDAFRPHPAVVAASVAAQAPFSVRQRQLVRRALGGLLACVLVALVAVQTLRPGRQNLKIDPELAERPPPAPAYLGRARPESEDSPRDPANRSFQRGTGSGTPTTLPRGSPLQQAPRELTRKPTRFEGDTSGQGKVDVPVRPIQFSTGPSKDLTAIEPHRMVPAIPVPSRRIVPESPQEPAPMFEVEPASAARAKHSDAMRELASVLPRDLERMSDELRATASSARQPALSKTEDPAPRPRPSSLADTSDTVADTKPPRSSRSEPESRADRRVGAAQMARTGQQTPGPAAETPLAQAQSAGMDSATEKSNTQPISTSMAAKLIDRYVETYEQGDLDGFANLFTTDARVNEGRGAAFIRSLYADFFRHVPYRRLAIGPLQWRSVSNTAALAEATLRLSSRSRDDHRWRHNNGRIRFKIIREMDRYRIAEMHYTLKASGE